MTPSITWFGHATFRLILTDGRVIFIDPWLRENPSCLSELKEPERCDMIVLTHGHPDHADDVPELVKKFDPPVVANYDLCMALQNIIGKGRYEYMNTGGTHAVDGVRITLTQAFHSSGVYNPRGPAYGGMPNGVIICTGDRACVYHAGDTDVFSDMKLIAKLYEPKICILPIGDRFTMGAKGAALAAEMLQPVAIIPSHYKTFPILAQSADEFMAALSEDMRKCVHLAEVGLPLPWTKHGLE
ncbi:MAG: metal-dependent hydrolase [Planctomycetes bacterium]|nr:metal-dependent hydrolase [Planctomycetota bacterium]MBI3834778.1 metal-dependent hydrolase [Planctomycetota bacterium]